MASFSTCEDNQFYQGFRRLEIEADGVEFAGVVGGAGPPLLLLHGYPETHIAWRRLVPALAARHKVIIPDIPGYGDSTIVDRSQRWTKRRSAKALRKLMEVLGHGRFGVIGHDRGARIGYRLALDYPDQVAAFASLAVVPTLDAIEAVDYQFALKNFHWFLFGQSDDLAERLLAADADGYLDRVLARMTEGRDFLEQTAVKAYHKAFRRESVRHAIIEDYRAAMKEDLEHDRLDRNAGHKLRCPVLVSWPREGARPDSPSPIDVWRRWADDVTGGATSGGHLQPEDAPHEVLALLVPFLLRFAIEA